ncbi:MAG: hypothetical protein B6U86_01825 [Candidatus Altiarchaeales archaeon ex4484_43]|nr:MAG: hypothetical protein B6U86_01825 [Candidatus Altiarchaeales archaeon ex4484_43]
MTKKFILLMICINCASAQLLINEIMYNPSKEQGSDSYNEWIELFNPTNDSINIENWTLCGDKLIPGYVNHTDGKIRFNLTTIVPPGKYALITDGGTGTEVYENFNVNLSSVALHTNSSSICNGLSNDFGELSLRNSEGILIDFVNYSQSWGANGDGKTIERSNSSEWNYSRVYNGTPGFENSLFMPTSTTTTSTTSTTTTTTTTSTTSTTTLPRPRRRHHYPPRDTTSTTTSTTTITTTTTTTTSTTTSSTTTTTTTTTTTAAKTTTSTSTTATLRKVQAPEPVGKAISSPKESGSDMLLTIIPILFLIISTGYLTSKRTKKKKGHRDL